MIADALTATPPAVTKNATIYAWDKKWQMILLRTGSGPYVCHASGFLFTLVGKTLMPYPDPMFLDQNAWNFVKHFLSEKNPMKPSRPYPTAPVLCWMLAGMAVKGGMVEFGSGTQVEVTVAKSGVKIVRISPHLMIMPFPVNERTAGMSTKYDAANPVDSQIIAAKTPNRACNGAFHRAGGECHDERGSVAKIGQNLHHHSLSRFQKLRD